ncbi:hypothetical protein RDI58_004480 [Solanum bulbocastanum]
MSSKNS